MIARDWQRLAFNLLLAPPLAYLTALGALCLLLVIPAALSGSDPSVIGLVVFVALPAIALTARFGSRHGLDEGGS